MQKHPPQLNALAFLPVEEMYSSTPFINTYYNRYGLLDSARRNFWWGWSLGEVLLASVRFRDIKEVDKDFNNLIASTTINYYLLDKNYTQFFESSTHGGSYFITTHGLVNEAITEMFVQSYKGVCDIFPVVLDSMKKSKEPVVFENFATPFGYNVSGTLKNGQCKLEIKNNFGKKLKLNVHNIDSGYTVYDEAGKKLGTGKKDKVLELGMVPGKTYTVVTSSFK